MKFLKVFSKTTGIFLALFFTVFSIAHSQSIRTINIVGTNRMKFNVASKQTGLKVGKKLKGNNGQTLYRLKSIIAKPGEKLKIVLHNHSKLPANSMSHDWVLLKQGVNPQKVANKSAQAKNNNYIAPSVENEIIAHTGLVSGGHSDSVTFTVPQKSGKYVYMCTFPGHYMAGMKGTLVVK